MQRMWRPRPPARASGKEALLILPRLESEKRSSLSIVNAIENVLLVTLYRLWGLLATLRAEAELPPARLGRRKSINVALLAIEEIGGFVPTTRNEASVFCRRVNYRCGRDSILTGNKSIKDSPGLFAGDAVLARSPSSFGSFAIAICLT